MTSSAASDTDRARKRTGAPVGVVTPREPLITSLPPLPLPPGRCTSSSTTSGRVRATTVDRGVDVRGLADDLQRRVELGLDPRPEHAVVVDEDEADRVGHGRAPCGSVGGRCRPGRPGRERSRRYDVRRAGRCGRVRRVRRRPADAAGPAAAVSGCLASGPGAAVRGLTASGAGGRCRPPVGPVTGRVRATSVPSSSRRSRAVPPWRRIRPMIDSRTPSRSAGTASTSKPGAVVADERLDHLRARPRRRPRPAARRAARR